VGRIFGFAMIWVFGLGLVIGFVMWLGANYY